MGASSDHIYPDLSNWLIAPVLSVRVRLHPKQHVLCKVQYVQRGVWPGETCVIAKCEDSGLAKLCLFSQPYWPEILGVPLPRPSPFRCPSQSMNENEIYLRFGRGVDQREA